MKILNNKKNYLTLLLLSSLYSSLSLTHPIASARIKETHPQPSSITFSLSGIEEKIAHPIKKNLTLLKNRQENSLDSRQIKLFVERGTAEIQKILQSFGYYHAKVFAQIPPNQKKHWDIHYHIVTGKPVTVSTLQVNIIGPGEKNNEILTSLNQFLPKPDDILNHEIYTHSKNELLASAIHESYLDAFFSTHEILVDLDKNHADIHLTLNTLESFRVGQITFPGSQFNAQFLKRFAKFYEGEPYSPEKTLSFQTALQQSNYFKSVNIEPVPLKDKNQVPLEVTLVPVKPNKYTLGLGYGTDTGIRGTMSWEKKYVNEWGHRFMLSLRAGEKNRRHETNFNYIIPGKFPITDNYRFHAGLHNEDYLNLSSKVQEFGLSQNRQIGAWQRVLTLSYREEKFEQYDTTLGRHDCLFLPSIQFIKIMSDDLFSPNIGHRFAFNLKAAIGPLLSDTTFFQPRIDYKYLRKFTPDTKFIFRTELGMTIPDDIDRIPLSQRFYAGGDQSLRGFGYRFLPKNLDKNGNIRAIGGGYLAIGSFEFEQKIYGPLSFALFSDAGNAFHRSNDSIEVSIGGGLRINTPIGPIKMDLAKPLTDNEQHWRIHVQIGPEL